MSQNVCVYLFVEESDPKLHLCNTNVTEKSFIMAPVFFPFSLLLIAILYIEPM